MLRWIAMVALALVPATAGARARPAVTPAAGPVAYLLLDADDGTVLAEKDAHKRWPPASMTKMMTVLIAMERVRDGTLSLDEPVRTSAWASRIGGSQVYLAEGEAFPLRDMLQAIMIASANDASVAVAEHVAGSPAAFVDLMNARAQALGLAETTYQSPHGLPPAAGQAADLTSAHDLGLLARELMRFPEVMEWAGTPRAGFRNDTLQMANTNHLVRNFPGATGLKTGYYAAAGFSVTASARRGDLGLVAVVLGLPTKRECFAEAARLLNEGFATYRVIAAATRGEPVAHVAVQGGAQPEVQALAVNDLRLLVKRSDGKMVTELRTPPVVAPVRRGQALGEVVVRRGAETVGQVAVVAERDVPATGWLSWLWNRGVSATTP